jgi:hypothetical protein
MCSKYFINADPPPPRDVFGVVFVDSEKMTFLEIFDMYLIIFVIFSQHVSIFSQYLIICCYIQSRFGTLLTGRVY